MTVSTVNEKIIYNGNGSTTNFPFSWAMPGGLTPTQSSTQIVVTYIPTSGVPVVVPYGTANTQYQLSINAPIPPNPTAVGGSIFYQPLGVPIPVGSTLTIERVMGAVQFTSLQNQGTLWQTVIEQSLDYLTMLVQQVQATFGRFIEAPSTDPAGISYTLPTVAQRANQGLVFDSGGNVTTGALPASGVISAPMVPVVGASSLANARAALGLGNLATFNRGAALQDDGAGNIRVDFGMASDTGTVTVNTGFHLTQRVTQGINTQYFLPLTTTLWNGFGFWIFAQTQTILTPNPADSIFGAPSGQKVTVPADSQVWVSTDSVGAWYLQVHAPVAFPGGYLTVSTDTLLPMRSVVDTPNIWYRPAINSYVPIYTGSLFIPEQFDDTLQLQLDAVNHPSGQIYDVFAFVSGIVGLVTGPAWRQPGVAITGATNATPIQITTGLPHNLNTGDLTVISGVEGNADANGRWIITVTGGSTFTLDGSVPSGVYTANTGFASSRGNGPGTSELQRISGIYVNAQSLSGHNFGSTFPIPPAQGTYLGSIYTNAAAAVTCRVATGPQRVWGVFNAYNRHAIRVLETDNTPTWNYNLVPYQVANGVTTNSIVLVIGLPEEIIEFTYEAKSTFSTTSGIPGSGGGGRAGIYITGNGSGGIVPSGFVDDKAAWITTVAATASSLGGPQNFHARCVTRPIMGVVQAFPIQAGPTVGAAGVVSWFGTEANMLFGARWNG